MATASSTGDGSDVTTWNSTTCSTVEYQTITSHGNAAVTDAVTPTVVQHNRGYTYLTPYGYTTGSKEGIVHIPVAAPIAMTIDPALLQNIIVKFTSAKQATVENVYLYYDTDVVAQANPRKSGTFYVTYTGKECSKAGYAAGTPKGISLTLDLNFPSADATISLQSVELVYLYRKAS